MNVRDSEGRDWVVEPKPNRNGFEVRGPGGRQAFLQAADQNAYQAAAQVLETIAAAIPITAPGGYSGSPLHREYKIVVDAEPVARLADGRWVLGVELDVGVIAQ